MHCDYLDAKPIITDQKSEVQEFYGQPSSVINRKITENPPGKNLFPRVKNLSVPPVKTTDPLILLAFNITSYK